MPFKQLTSCECYRIINDNDDSDGGAHRCQLRHHVLHDSRALSCYCLALNVIALSTCVWKNKLLIIVNVSVNVVAVVVVVVAVVVVVVVVVIAVGLMFLLGSLL